MLSDDPIDAIECFVWDVCLCYSLGRADGHFREQYEAYERDFPNYDWNELLYRLGKGYVPRGILERDEKKIGK